MPHKQFRGAERRLQLKRKNIKKGQSGENWFQVLPLGVAQDGEILFLRSVAAASESDDGLRFWK